jgi:hypothetical protein
MSEGRGAPKARGGGWAPGMSLSFTARGFQEWTRREFYRVALRALLETGRCSPEHEERLIQQLRREENAYR